MWPRVMISVLVIVISLTGAFPAFATQIQCQPAGQIHPPFPQCPPVGAATSCRVLFYIDSNGSLRVFTDPSQGPLDGLDDTLIGIQNDWTGHAITSIPLRSPLPLFAFDDDGICGEFLDGYPLYDNEPDGCPFDWSLYAGPMNHFPPNSISADKTSGLVNFWSPGLLSGQCTYFSLEALITTVCPPLPTTVPLIKQNVRPGWGTDIYDSLSPYTIGGKGCMLTSAAMIINYQATRQGSSFSTTPRLLNNWLISQTHNPKGYVAGDVNPYAVGKYAQLNGVNLYFHGRVRKRNDFILDSYLCNGDPVILGVNNNGHWIVATGQTTVNGTDSYSINDPGHNCSDLSSCYNYTYKSMRIYSMYPMTPIGLFFYVHSPVELFVTDPNGQRSGFDVGTGETLLEIPKSGYDVEFIEDDIDPVNGGTTPEVKSLETLEPASGNYALQIIGTGTGPYTVEILAYDATGTESIQTITGSASPGVGAVHQVGYSSASGSQVTQTFMNNIYTITASAGSGGSISPGTVVVNSGGSQTFIITPNTGYSIADVTIDSISHGAITSYTFVNVTAPHTITATFADTTPPTGSITINGGAAYTNSASVTLTLSATDPSGVSQMCISNTASCSTWETYATSKSWTLPTGDGSKTVYAWFKDTVGNANTTPYSDTITLDATAPANGTLSATAGNTQVSLSWSGFSDATSGIESYKLVYSTGAAPSSCSSGTQIYLGTGTSYTHTGLTNGTTYYYRVCAIDNAQNTSSGATASATAIACSNLPVRIAGNYYSSIQAAYSVVPNGGTIQVQAQTITENPTMNRNISITLQGGYDCGYTTYTGNVTNLKGMIQTVAGGGIVTIRNFDIVQ